MCTNFGSDFYPKTDTVEDIVSKWILEKTVLRMLAGRNRLGYVHFV
jgi:hypothetical protein